MQERVLGALIIGAIALTGLIWGTVEGVAASIKVNNDEKQLEENVKETINKEFTNLQKSKYDLKMIRYKTIEDTSSKRGTVVYLFVDFCGYTDDNKEFTYGIVTNERDYVRDALNKKFDSIFTIDPKWSEAEKASKIEFNDNVTKTKMKNDLSKNYTVTTPENLISLLGEKDIKTYKYVLDNDVKYQVDYIQNEETKKVESTVVVDKK